MPQEIPLVLIVVEEVKSPTQGANGRRTKAHFCYRNEVACTPSLTGKVSARWNDTHTEYQDRNNEYIRVEHLGSCC